MRQEQVAEVMNDPLSQELLHSAIPARIAYNGTDGFPRAIPIGFLWKDVRTGYRTCLSDSSSSGA
jgi:hypothetical protein